MCLHRGPGCAVKQAMRKRKGGDRLTDPFQIAHAIIDEVEQMADEREKDANAVALGRKGGIKGGAARAANLTAEQRKEIAQKAAAKRWGRAK